MSMLNTLNISGHQPNLHILDNESLSSMRQVLLKNNINYQLAPAHPHRINSDEHAIQTFKAHLITYLCAADSGYLEKEWDSLLPQETLNLNLLRNCRFNPKLSAHEALNGIFDYNKTPLGPLGARVVVHEKTTNFHTWSPHVTDGWYIGPYLEYY